MKVVGWILILIGGVLFRWVGQWIVRGDRNPFDQPLILMKYGGFIGLAAVFLLIIGAILAFR